MDLVAELRSSKPEVIAEAAAGLERAHLAHYEASGSEDSRRRLDVLYDFVVGSIEKRELRALLEYTEQVATERFEAGFGISEVQMAFNLLEEAIWRLVITGLPAEELIEATGLVGTVLGAGKDRLASVWVSLAARRHVPSLDLRALFGGTGG